MWVLDNIIYYYKGVNLQISIWRTIVEPIFTRELTEAETEAVKEAYTRIRTNLQKNSTASAKNRSNRRGAAYSLFRLAVNQRPLRCHYIMLRAFVPRTGLVACTGVYVHGDYIRAWKARDNAHATFARFPVLRFASLSHVVFIVREPVEDFIPDVTRRVRQLTADSARTNTTGHDNTVRTVTMVANSKSSRLGIALSWLVIERCSHMYDESRMYLFDVSLFSELWRISELSIIC